MREEYSLPVQSHLSENPAEPELVKKCHPAAKYYGMAYDMFGLFGGDYPTVMAHCIYSGDEEQAKMRENHVHIAHCPGSNFNLTSGIAPVQWYWNMVLALGLGTDIAGGFSLSLFRAIQDAISASKLYWQLSLRKNVWNGAVTWRKTAPYM